MSPPPWVGVHPRPSSPPTLTPALSLLLRAYDAISRALLKHIAHDLGVDPAWLEGLVA